MSNWICIRYKSKSPYSVKVNNKCCQKDVQDPSPRHCLMTEEAEKEMRDKIKSESKSKSKSESKTEKDFMKQIEKEENNDKIIQNINS